MGPQEMQRSIEELRETVQHLLRKDVGLIIYCASEEPPGDAIPCDGREYDVRVPGNEKFVDLLRKIRNRWGGDGVYTFAVPDARGEFLRGWDGRDGDEAPIKKRGVDSNRVLGSSQDWATALERGEKVFSITGDGRHIHVTGPESAGHTHAHDDYCFAEVQGGNHGMRGNKGDSDTDNGPVSNRAGARTGGASDSHTHEITLSGDHSHGITGGDTETRPRNLAFPVYIRF